MRGKNTNNKASRHNMTIDQMNIKENWINYIHSLQDRICAALEKEDGKATFREDQWERSEGGGGKTRVIANGNVFEKGGVNTSVVYGKVTDEMRAALKIPALEGHDPEGGFACGLSLVIHPQNPGDRPQANQ